MFFLFQARYQQHGHDEKHQANAGNQQTLKPRYQMAATMVMAQNRGSRKLMPMSARAGP